MQAERLTAALTLVLFTTPIPVLPQDVAIYRMHLAQQSMSGLVQQTTPTSEMQGSGINHSHINFRNLQVWKGSSLEKDNFGNDRVWKNAISETIQFGKDQNWQCRWPFLTTVVMQPRPFKCIAS